MEEWNDIEREREREMSDGGIRGRVSGMVRYFFPLPLTSYLPLVKPAMGEELLVISDDGVFFTRYQIGRAHV